MNRFLLFISLLPFIAAYSQETERCFVYFNYNDFQLTLEATRKLDDIIDLTKNCTVTKVELYGHTDGDGDPEANKVLAQNRINSVKSYLVEHNVASHVIVQQSFGEQYPAFPNETEAGMRKNRRVEVVFTYTCGIVVSAEPPAPIVSTDTTLQVQIFTGAITREVVSDTQRFVGKGNTEIVINGKQGTIITFEKNSFIDVKGKIIAGEIQFQLIEVYKQSDMVRSGLATVSNGKLLESGGMIYITASSNGQTANFSDKVWAYEISFPASDKKYDMGIFYADSAIGPSDWEPASRSWSGDVAYLKNRETLDRYVFNSTEMGWINCDRFLNDKKLKLTDVVVDMTDTTGVSFALVFKDINSAMASGGGRGPVKFANVPIGYEVTLIAFRKTGETYEYFSKDFTVEKNHRESVVLEKLTEEEFENRLKELD